MTNPTHMQNIYAVMERNAVERRATAYHQAIDKYNHLLEAATKAGDEQKAKMYIGKLAALKAHS